MLCMLDVSMSFPFFLMQGRGAEVMSFCSRGGVLAQAGFSTLLASQRPPPSCRIGSSQGVREPEVQHNKHAIIENTKSIAPPPRCFEFQGVPNDSAPRPDLPNPHWGVRSPRAGEIILKTRCIFAPC